MKKLFTAAIIALVFCLCMNAIALTFTDAHGNVIELDASLEAYSKVNLSGADDSARKAETNLGDFWTDALRWFVVSGEVNAYFDEDDIAAGITSVDAEADDIVALWNGGNLRADIPEGKFGADQLAQVLPYPNKVAIVYMTGAQLAEALEAASQSIPYADETAAACAAFMQVSGLEYTIDITKPYDKGEAYGNNWFKAASLSRVTVTSVNGKAFDAVKAYAVVTSNANFNGMDSSYMFKEAAENNEKSTVTTAVVRDVVWQYLAKALGSTIDETYAIAQGRITIAN